MSTHLRKLIAHLEWADAAALRALRESPGTDIRALTLYAHTLGAEANWLARVAGRRSDVAIWPTLTLDEASALARRNAEELAAIVESSTAEDLAGAIVYRNSAGTQFTSTLEDILLHVALHGAYHRGQVALVIRGSGGEPAPTDYIAFVRGAPAARTMPPIPVAHPR